MDIDISVIVPVYNCEEEIKKSVQSLTGQTKKEIEIILVNDGSTDKSLQVCNALAKEDSRITVVTQENKGVSGARNRGIALAQGRAIMFVDADDHVDKAICQSLWDIYKRGNSYCICGYAHEFCNMRNKTVKGRSIVPKKKEYEKLDTFFQDMPELYKNYLIFTPVAKLYDAEVIRKNQIRFDESISVGEDLLFNIVFLEYCGRIGSINKALYYYRHKEKGKSLTSTFNPKRIGWAEEIYRKTYQFAKKHNKENEMRPLILDKYYRYSICTLEVLYSGENTLGRREKKKFLSQVIHNTARKKIPHQKLSFETKVYAILFQSRRGWLLKMSAILREKIKRFFR